MVIGPRYVEGGGTSRGGPRAPCLLVANKYIALWPASRARTRARYAASARGAEATTSRHQIKGYVVHGEMAYQAWVNGFRLGEVPIHFKNRARDASKLTGQEIYMALLNFAFLRFRYGFRPKRKTAPAPSST